MTATSLDITSIKQDSFARSGVAEFSRHRCSWTMRFAKCGSAIF